MVKSHLITGHSKQELEKAIIVKGCDSNFVVDIFQIFKVAANETSTLH